MGIVIVTATTQLYKHGIYCIYQPTFEEFFRSPYSNSCPTSLTPCDFCLGVTSLPEAMVTMQGIVREQSKLMGVDLSVSSELFSIVHYCSITLP